MADTDASNSSRWDSRMWGQEPLIRRDRIKRGHYIDCYCPHCDGRLNDGDMAVFEAETADGAVGSIRVAAYLNAYHHETDLSLQEGSELKDLRCPHCHRSLILIGSPCGDCDGRVAGFRVAAGRSRVDLQVCVRHGCRWYELDADDEQLLLLEGSDEW